MSKEKAADTKRQRRYIAGFWGYLTYTSTEIWGYWTPTGILLQAKGCISVLLPKMREVVALERENPVTHKNGRKENCHSSPMGTDHRSHQCRSPAEPGAASAPGSLLLLWGQEQICGKDLSNGRETE